MIHLNYFLLNSHGCNLYFKTVIVIVAALRSLGYVAHHNQIGMHLDKQQYIEF